MKEMGRMTRVVRETSIKNAEIAEDFLEKRREASEGLFEKTQRTRGFRCACGAGIKKDTQEN